jgi:hypothetical protein
MINILQKGFKKGKNPLQRRVRRLYLIHVTVAVKARPPDAASRTWNGVGGCQSLDTMQIGERHNVELRRRRANQPLNGFHTPCMMPRFSVTRDTLSGLGAYVGG